MCRSTVHWKPHEIKALCFNLELRTKFFTLKCLYLSRASWRNGSIPHIWVSQNGTETTNPYPSMSPSGSLYPGWSSGVPTFNLSVSEPCSRQLCAWIHPPAPSSKPSCCGSDTRVVLLHGEGWMVGGGWAGGGGGSIPCIMIGLDEVARARGRTRRKERSRWR